MGMEQLGTWRVSAVARSVPQLRRSLRDKIAGRGFDNDAVALAATEAITNVVRHAYPGSAGPVTLSVEASAEELLVVVADEGIGSRTATTSREPSLGMGLALIHELSASARIEPTNTGTTVTMRFTKTMIDHLGRSGQAPP
jgi:anti-sigma regulatory factor (Ser/Thr protein kinase)